MDKQHKDQSSQMTKIQKNQQPESQSPYQGLEFERVLELDNRLASDEKLLAEFEADPELVFKNEGLSLPPSMKVRFAQSYAKDLKSAPKSEEAGEEIQPPRFETRIGHIIIDG